MLEQARTRPDVEWVLGDLSTVRWDREFDLVVMMGHTFHQFIEDEEIRSTLAAIHAALVDGGRFAFEVHNPLIRPWETWATDYQRQENDAHGAVVNVESTAEPSDREDVFVFTWTFSSPAWDEPKVSRGPMRFLGAEALSSFLSEAGFVTEEHYGSWDRHPLTATSEEIITVARKR
jgi:SAM-dependent methyltransferase